ncbi:MAG: LytR/AlgR family response regulator transcription factor [Vulcanibacillus sp.]
MELKTLIVDDEYPAREELRFLLSKYECINVVGEATCVSEALTLIESIEYQLVFLDINFPVSNGINIGLSIQSMKNPPLIIYVTAHEAYAVNAFDVDAVDYILKPIDEKKLKRAIDRAINEYQKKDGNTLTNNDTSVKEVIEKEKVTRLTAEANGKIKLVDVSEIYYAYTEDNYVFLKTFDKKLITRLTLTVLESKLDAENFFRTHRSYIVNLNKVFEILPTFNGAYSLVMEDKEHSKVPVSRIQTKELRKLLLF